MANTTDGTSSLPPQRESGIARWVHSDWPWVIGALLLFGMAAAQVASTWTVLSAVLDEPGHMALGMEWLDKGTYTCGEEFQHPPISRVVLALVPYLTGLRSHSLADPRAEGNAILCSAGDYRRNLAYARSGNLIFLALGCFSVFLWARRWFGKPAAFWSVLLFVSVPPVLGHTGLATLDIASAASMMLALYALVRCLEDPAWPKLVFLGASVALAFLCKLSSLAFIPACMVCGLVYARVKWWSVSPKALPWRRLVRRGWVVAGVLFVVLWAGYRFSWKPISVYERVHPAIDRVLGNRPALRSFVHKAADVPFPLSEIATGIWQTVHHDKIGNGSYLFGEFRGTGWWYFFPVVVGVKTPIGFLILAGCGVFAILRGFRSGPWQQHLTVVFPLAIMLVCVASRIDIGVRHILAIYPLLAVIAGYAVAELFLLARRRSLAILVLPAILVAWVVADSWMARPDYMAYFNELAGGHPERIRADSDLDWGQDLYRLSDRLRELHADHVSLAYFGGSLVDRAGLPPYSRLSPDVPTTHGYVAVSLQYLTVDYARDGSYAWLKHRTPLEKVGKSIYLYDFGQ